MRFLKTNLNNKFNKTFILMGLDQGISSLFSILIPSFILLKLGDQKMNDFVITQSYWIYINSIVSSIIINPYLYLEKIGISKSSYLYFLSRILIILLFISFFFVKFLDNSTILMASLFFAHFFKESIRIINIQKGHLLSNILFQLAYIVPLVILSFCNVIPFEKLLKSYYYIIFFLGLLYFASQSKVEGDYYKPIKNSFSLGQWSLYNLLIQLTITQIIIFRLQSYDNKEIIVYYGVILTMVNVINPFVQMVNNFTIKYFRLLMLDINRLEILKKFKRYSKRLTLLLIILSPIFYISFHPLVKILYGVEYIHLSFLFLLIYLTVIPNLLNQLNSRILTLYDYRRVVLETGIVSLISISIFCMFSWYLDWEKFLFIGLLTVRLSAYFFSKFRLNQKIC
jgi:hypothetical protein